MKQSSVLLSIIIVSYNTRELLEKCLDSVIKSLASSHFKSNQEKILNQVQDDANRNRHPDSSGRHPDPSHRHPDESQDLSLAEIIVVDNHSTDGTKEYLKEIQERRNLAASGGRNLSRQGRDEIKISRSKFPNFKVIFNNDNLGFAKANNQGIKIAEGKYIMLLNSDTIVKDRALEKMVSFLEKRKEFAILGPKLLNADGTPQPSLGKFPTLPVVAAMLFLEHFLPASLLRVRWSPKNEREGDWVMGAALLLRREVYKKIGGLDENIFMYMEEVEWCFRAKKAGFRVYFYPQAEIIHLGRGSSKSGKKEPILQIFRGLIYFYEKHQPSWKKEILLFLLKLKANLSFFLGILTGNSYLKKTYGEAKKIT